MTEAEEDRVRKEIEELKCRVAVLETILKLHPPQPYWIPPYVITCESTDAYCNKTNSPEIT